MVILLKLRIRENSNIIKERLQKLGSDMFITDYAGDIVNLLVNKPKEYRFLYDAQADLYMIGDAFNHIHFDMLKKAFDDGWYESQKEFIDEWVCGWFKHCAPDYFDHAQNGFEFDEDDERDFDLINCDYDDSYVYPWVYCFVFVPSGGSDEDMNDWLTDDGYENTYKFSFGTVYTRNFALKECSDIERALKRADNS